MKINVYCKDKGWLFEDLKKSIASYGAIPSENPLANMDGYICIRTKEANLSPKPKKTLVQVHDTDKWNLSSYGITSLVHPVQTKTIKSNNVIVQPIGTREIPLGEPEEFTLGYFCREVSGKKRSALFEQAVLIARKEIDFKVLMIGQKLESISYLGEYENRASVPDDYKRISAFFTSSISPMIPLSAYEACAAGKPIISTPREWIIEPPYLHEGVDAKGLAKGIIDIVKSKMNYKPSIVYKRDDWAKKQINAIMDFLT